MPPARHRAPRRVAAERPPVVRGRGEGHRLRHRQGARRARAGPAEDTRARQLQGKFGYMSPEQARGERGRRAERSLLARHRPLRVRRRREPVQRADHVRDAAPRAGVRVPAGRALATRRAARARRDPEDGDGEATRTIATPTPGRMYEALLAFLYSHGRRFSAHDLAEFLARFRSASEQRRGVRASPRRRRSRRAAAHAQERTPVEVPPSRTRRRACASRSTSAACASSTSSARPEMGERREVTALVIELPRGARAPTRRRRAPASDHRALRRARPAARGRAASPRSSASAIPTGATPRSRRAARSSRCARSTAARDAERRHPHRAHPRRRPTGDADRRRAPRRRSRHRARSRARPRRRMRHQRRTAMRQVKALFDVRAARATARADARAARVAGVAREGRARARARRSVASSAARTSCAASARCSRSATQAQRRACSPSAAITASARRACSSRSSGACARADYNVGFYIAACPPRGREFPLSGIVCMLQVLCGVGEGDSHERIVAVQPRLRALGLHDEEVERRAHGARRERARRLGANAKTLAAHGVRAHGRRASARTSRTRSRGTSRTRWTRTASRSSTRRLAQLSHARVVFALRRARGLLAPLEKRVASRGDRARRTSRGRTSSASSRCASASTRRPTSSMRFVRDARGRASAVHRRGGQGAASTRAR